MSAAEFDAYQQRNRHNAVAEQDVPTDGAGHTPGPWKANIGSGGCNVVVNSTMLAPVVIPINPDWLLTHPDLVEEAQANANLIASAPRLLAKRDALRDALSLLATVCNAYDNGQKLPRAIVEATAKSIAALALCKEDK